MSWSRFGTVSVTNGSTTVTGTNAAFDVNGRVGDAFQGPDGRWYEVTNISSGTVLSILPAYQGESVTGGVYGLAPMQGYVKESADRLRAITVELRSVEEDVASAKQAAANAAAAASEASDSASLAEKASDDAAQAAGSAAASQQDSEQHQEAARKAADDALSYLDSASDYKDQAEVSARSAADSAAAAAQSAENVAGKANSGENNDITSLTGLTTPLSVEQGGTGSAEGVPVMRAASPAVAGTKGLVPAPGAGDEGKVLHGDGSWKEVTSGGAGRFFGELVALPSRNSSPDGVIKADGQIIARASALYPDAVADIKKGSAASVRVTSMSQWTADPSKRAYWAYNQATDELRVPDLNGRSAGSLGAVFFRGDGTPGFFPGDIRQDQIQNITGEINTNPNMGVIAPTGVGTGALTKSTKTYPNVPTQGALANSAGLAFDASLSARTGSETFPVHTPVVWGVVLFGAISNPGAADAAALATSYANQQIELNALKGELAVQASRRWQDMTANRAYNVAYTSPSDRDIVLGITTQSSSGLRTELYLGNSMVAGVAAGSGGPYQAICTFVPRNTAYKLVIVSGSSASLTWMEYR